MPKYIDRTGTEFNGIIFLRRAENKGQNVMWLCKCTCGNEYVDRAEHIFSGRKCPDCGRKSQSQKISKHGKYKDALYAVWLSMKQRCNNPKCKAYKDYGGRGISVCSEWADDYLIFAKWANDNGYQKGLSIDRIDVNGNYEPSNCRWLTISEQQMNKRTNHLITFNGETDTITNMARKYGFEPSTIEGRLTKNKWTIEKALTTPVKILS